MIDMAKRKRIMSRSIMLGHCVCDPRKPCPCPDFREHDVCECAGEKLPFAVGVDGEIKLTDYVKSAGCASKIGKKDLFEILSDLPLMSDPRVIIGVSACDDAGAILVPDTKENAMIQTVDVFSPSVDDPYTFGQVSAANSVSDIYAMGAEPWCALSIIGFSVSHMPNKVMAEILRGGLDKMKEAGVPVLGGHSINDENIKCGFAVTGFCKKDKIIRNEGARIGDAIVLTKPIGVGIAAFAKQIGRAEKSTVSEAERSMIRLNKSASQLMVKYKANAATDVTGYSLLGHMSEIVKNSKVKVEIDFDAIPLIDGVANLARMGICPGAIEKNREAVSDEILDVSGLAEAQANLLFCPETSGGLLVFLPKENLNAFISDLHLNGDTASRVIGYVSETNSKGRIVVKTSSTKNYESIKIKRQNPEIVKKNIDSPATISAEPSCCASESSCCAKTNVSVSEKESSLPSPANSAVFFEYLSNVMSSAAIDNKNKKLIALALSVVTKCEPCVKINLEAVRKAGASEEEISEAVSMGIAFGGAPVAMFYNNLK